MTTIHDIMQVGVGMPDLERFENFARDMLGFPVTKSPGRKGHVPEAGSVSASDCSVSRLPNHSSGSPNSPVEKSCVRWVSSTVAFGREAQ